MMIKAPHHSNKCSRGCNGISSGVTGNVILGIVSCEVHVCDCGEHSFTSEINDVREAAIPSISLIRQKNKNVTNWIR